MKQILAVDTSQIQAAVALVRDGKLVDSVTGNVAVSHSEALMPLIDELLKRAGLKVSDIDAFGVGVGPGSFTGIRIGCATVKGLAQVLNKPVLPFSSLRALAYSVDGSLNVTVAMANAYQGQVFAGWQGLDGNWNEDVLPAAEWCSRFAKPMTLRNEIRFCGNGSTVYRAAIEEAMRSISPNYKIIDQTSYVAPSGVLRAISEASVISYAELQANYVRLSEAEIKLKAKVAK